MGTAAASRPQRSNGLRKSMGDLTYRKRDARCIGIKGKWWLRESFLADVSGKIHGLVEDAGDLNAFAPSTIKNKVLGDLECTAAIREISSGIAARENWVVRNAGSRDGKEL